MSSYYRATQYLSPTFNTRRRRVLTIGIDRSEVPLGYVLERGARFRTETDSVHKPDTVSVFVFALVRYDRRSCYLSIGLSRAIPTAVTPSPPSPPPPTTEHDRSWTRFRFVPGQTLRRWYISTCGTAPGRCPRVASLEISPKVRLTCRGTRRSLHRFCEQLRIFRLFVSAST